MKNTINALSKKFFPIYEYLCKVLVDNSNERTIIVNNIKIVSFYVKNYGKVIYYVR